ncbi:MAG: FtsW/RodA/SpoVE family cell cycle protein [Phycisphaerae bacterium]|jgi:cell division protein FtsW|nr:FtsW/RodA/SpoVE family cell cycle protein [Phycisphaerae bacterium]
MAWNDKKYVTLPLSVNTSGSGLVVVTLAMLAIGIVAVHSALAGVLPSTVSWHARSDMRHTLFAVAAAVIMCFGWHFRYRWLGGGSSRWPARAAVVLLIAIMLTLMVHVPGLGHMRNGRLRWLKLAPAPYGIFQPSELLKIALLIFLAAWYSNARTPARSFLWGFVAPTIITGACLAMVVTQDLGTAVIMAVAVWLTMFLAGVRWYALTGLIAAGAGGFWWFVTSDPKRLERITAMVDPWCLSNPSAYQPRQSLLAILTGGWFGKGLGRGIVKQQYLPERSTDFIFASFSEEWGFVGAALLMGLVILWIWFARKSATNASDRFGFILAGAMGAMIAIQMILHIAVDTVAAPPTGMSFPFVSVGGTALLVTAAAASLIVSVSARAKQQKIPQPRDG